MGVHALFRDEVGWGHKAAFAATCAARIQGGASTTTLVTVYARPKARLILAVRAKATPLASASVRRRVRPDLIKIAAALFN